MKFKVYKFRQNIAVARQRIAPATENLILQLVQIGNQLRRVEQIISIHADNLVAAPVRADTKRVRPLALGPTVAGSADVYVALFLLNVDDRCHLPLRTGA